MGKNIEFNTVQVEAPNRNTFDMSFDKKLTADMGNIYPVFARKTLPGDIWNITPEMMIRLSPMIAPVMHKIDARIHFYYVPYRLLWKNYDQWLQGKDVAMPFIQGTDEEPLPVTVRSLADYMGLPLSDNIKEPIDFAPFLAYSMIYNNYYQDQNNDQDYETTRVALQDLYEANGRITPAMLNPTSPDEYTLPLMQCAYEHDLFTSALPFAQKGDAVNIPLSISQLIGDVTVTNVEELLSTDPLVGALIGAAAPAGQLAVGTDAAKLTGIATIDGAGAELAGTINQLRTAFATQKFLELMARGGTRYHELIKAEWNEDIGDARINRPEYIGGIKNNVVISEVLQTSQSDPGTNQPLGQFAGHGTTYMEGNNVNYKCTEHGWIIGLMTILPKTAYYQGIPKMFTELSYLDIPHPLFSHIGEESIKNKELYYDSTLTDNDDDFGYRPRFSTYKCSNSEVAGLMRTSLDFWHLGRKFSNRPLLNKQFIYVQNDKRIFAVEDPDTDAYIVHVYFNANKTQRKLPIFSTPAGL